MDMSNLELDNGNLVSALLLKTNVREDLTQSIAPFHECSMQVTEMGYQ
jgi:hypothetical protein